MIQFYSTRWMLFRKSFGGSPNSRNVLSLQIFLKGDAKPSPGNTSAVFPRVKWPQILLNLTSLCTKISQTFTGTFSGILLNLTCLCTEASQTFSRTFSGTFSGTLLNLTWLDLLRNLLRNPVEPDLALHQNLPDLLRNLRNVLGNLVGPDLAPAPVLTGAIVGWRPH